MTGKNNKTINTEQNIEQAKLITEIDVSAAGPGSRMFLGDLTGNNRLDVLMVQPDTGIDDRYVPHQVQALTAYDLEGNILWQKGEVGQKKRGAGSDIPVQIYDIDGDGYNEVLCVMEKEFIILEGQTGQVKNSYQLPGKEAHDCIIIANLTNSKKAQDIILKDRYHKMWALNNDFEVLWTHEGNIGHFPWPVDINDDGFDEIMAGYDLLDHQGNVLWSCQDLDDHADCIAVGDVNQDGKKELVIGGSCTVMYDRQGKEIWRYNGSVESQHIALGRYQKDSDQIFVAGLDRIVRGGENARDALFLLSTQGQEIWKENRETTGWLTIVETLPNWQGQNQDYILAYRRGGGLLPGLYDSDMRRVVTFPREGNIVYGDLYGRGHTDVIVHQDKKAYVYSNSRKDLNSFAAGETKPRQQSKRLAHRTLYPGMELD
ncbi:MAG: hypothetical protein ACOC2G_03560 [Bacillota bacterium]